MFTEQKFSDVRNMILFRSSHPEMFFKRVLLKISQNSQENTYARVSFVINMQADAGNFIKKETWHRCFPVNFAKIEREFCGIFWVKVVAKHMALGPLGPHFMHMRVNKMIHRVDRKITASFNKFYGKMFNGFWLNTSKRFLLEVLF